MILRDQRKVEGTRVPLRVLQETKPSDSVENDDRFIPESLSFGFLAYQSTRCSWIEEEVEIMRKIPSPCHQNLINYEDFD